MAKKVKKKKTVNTSGSMADFMKSLSGYGGLSDISSRVDEFYKTGSPSLDRWLGGGLAKGQFYCVRGQRGTGKSLFALGLAKEVVDSGGNVAYFDTENKISRRAIDKVGLSDAMQDGRFQFLTIDTQKNAIDVMMQMIDSGLFALIVVDSLNGLYTEEQEERDIHEESKVGGYQSKTWSEWLPLLKHHATLQGCAVCLTQQARDNIGSLYGPSESYSGGKAIEHFATTILRFGGNKRGNEVVDGQVVRQGVTVRIDKNNQGALPNDSCELRFYVGNDAPWGIDKVSSLFEEAKSLGILAPRKVGTSYYVPSKELCEVLGIEEGDLTLHGQSQVMNALEQDETLFKAVEELVDKAISEENSTSAVTPLNDDTDEGTFFEEPETGEDD